ncbi:TolC family protein [Chryseobacterium cheonjiense]|uniref:TolC family protein n=1 Tax=Chryseobacterium cheonjiense TaxID=2728845 RepID=A0A7Y0AA39_9FLAO|nr:TolC family protein [Chryseobacterium cheonjiense]NML59278.1 TolC family protein [Chryseobacterium cheonjiense]
MIVLRFLLGIAFLFPAMSYAQQTLDYYIQTAKSNSPLIKDNQFQSEAARLELERLKSVYTKPQVGIVANYLMAPVVANNNGKTSLQLSPGNADSYYGQDAGLTNGGLYQGLVQVNQPLFMKSRFSAIADEAGIGIKINQNNIRLTNFELEKIITDQYILCLQDMHQIDFLTKYINILKDQKELTTKLVNSSVIKLSDLSLLDIELQTQLIAQQTMQASYSKNILDMNVLAGIPDSNSSKKITPLDLFLNNDNTESSFTEKYNLDSSRLVAQQKIFELKYKPQWNLFANGGFNTTDASLIYRRIGISAGVSFTMTLFDGGQKAINRTRTNFLLQTTQAYKENFLNQNSVRKNNFLQQINAIEERIRLTETQVKEYDKLLGYYKQELIRGQISVINYVNTIKNAIGLEKDFITMQTNRQLLINAYNYWNK